MSNYLSQALNDATTTRDAFVASMGTDYSRQNLDRLQALQAAVDAAAARLEEMNNQSQVVESAPASSTTVGATCVVTLIRNGKSDRCVEVRADSTIGDIVNTLNTQEGGWDIRSLSFKRRVGPGQTADITDPSGTVLGEGTHEIWVGNKVAGGNC